MNAEWMSSPSARRVLQHDADARPVWLWTQDGKNLIWQNTAATLFLAKIKKYGLKLAAPAVPIKGQIARNIRLGSTGRTSLARIQFLAGDKPVSCTCATTPLQWEDGETALLIVGVDPIDPDIVTAAEMARDDGDTEAQTDVSPQNAPPQSVNVDTRGDENAGEAGVETQSLSDAIAAVIAADDDAYARELDSWHQADPDQGHAHTKSPDQNETAQLPSTEMDQPAVERAPSRLSDLVSRLAEDGDLYTPLTAADDVVRTRPAPGTDPQGTATPQLFSITGRGFVALDETGTIPPEQTDAEADLGDLERLDEGATPPPPAPVPTQTEMAAVTAALAELGPARTDDADAVERVSRYNFDELSRILNDRVGETAPQAGTIRPTESPANTGALVNLGAETLVLNRLPLGILVFRDQQILFANRAITEMVGYGSVETLRQAGLASVFPAAGPEGQEAGPVNHLVQRDGTMVPVTARLQSISWQGRPALMLSASATEVRTGHEGAVRAFAGAFAETRGDGFFETNRAGVIGTINGRAGALLGQATTALVGKPLDQIIASRDLPALREFLERPARFAETARPCVSLRSADNSAELLVFAQGQAGNITGYFGFVHQPERQAAIQISGPAEIDPALLARVSRGVRRPLNTIIGFSDLIRSGAFGALGNERYEGYAEDIAAAGHEIAALVDELDDFTRLRDGRYLPQRASIELTSLLESCVVRIRHQASNARVIVRNAISESLPKVTADRASLAQAVLNLLASAIDQTPSGSAVVISAQREDDGGIAIHVRDSSNTAVDLAERFVVFRDGTGKDGQVLAPVRSSVGLALTRSLLAVNAFSLSVDPAGALGLLFTLVIPADLVEQS